MMNYTEDLKEFTWHNRKREAQKQYKVTGNKIKLISSLFPVSSMYQNTKNIAVTEKWG